MKLGQLLNFDPITIQCHDNPDADSLGSAFGLYHYFTSQGKNVEMIYGGSFEVSKPNLTGLIEALNIPIRFVKDYSTDGLLITIDCQYGAGNVSKFDAKHVAIIDHHQVEITNIDLSEIHPSLGSCSTLVWHMISNEGLNVNEDIDVATALYYGLFTDTNNFAEIEHPLDKDMRDSLNYNASLIMKLKNSNLLLQDIETAGVALLRCLHNDTNNFSIFRAHPCDPNILGFISDMALQVNTIDCCIVYNETAFGLKFSVRSCVREVMANELASFLTEDMGSGGGHQDKAGGFINLDAFKVKYHDLNAEAYFLNKMKAYYDSFDYIYADNHTEIIDNMPPYVKKQQPLGYVPLNCIYPNGTPVLIRTLEGDIELNVTDDINIMIGIKGEVYPIKTDKFNQSYKTIEGIYKVDTEYTPHIKNLLNGENRDLIPLAKLCLPTGQTKIYVRKLLRDTKVFTLWDTSTYMLGRKDDYIAIRQDDLNDVYVIEKTIFPTTYEALV